MLDQLEESLPDILGLVAIPHKWNSLIINRRKPYTYRVYSTLSNGLRVCLHKFEPCDTHEAFFHPHPWPGAFIIMQGQYRMKVGYTVDRYNTIPFDVLTLELSKWSKYEIINPLTWHAVIPIETTYTIMVNGPPWDVDQTAHKSIRTTQGKDLESMPLDELMDYLSKFQFLLEEYFRF